jgi:hypothetical protein
MLNFALDEVLRDLSTQGRFFVVCFNAGVRGLGEGAWVPNLCPPVPVPLFTEVRGIGILGSSR